jgi:hypothetical protein
MQQPDTRQALAMFEAFASVGVRSFDVTFTDIDGAKISFQINRPIDELRRTIDKTLAAAIERKHNYIVRPRSNSVQLIQLDDLDNTKAEWVAPHAFLVLQT